MSRLAVVLVLAAVLAGVIFIAAKGVHDINRANDRAVTRIGNGSP